MCAALAYRQQKNNTLFLNTNHVHPHQIQWSVAIYLFGRLLLYASSCHFFSSAMLLVDGILCEGSSLLRLSSIASVSKFIGGWIVCVTDVLMCLVLTRGGFRDCGIANALLRAPLGGDGGGYEIPDGTRYMSTATYRHNNVFQCLFTNTKQCNF